MVVFGAGASYDSAPSIPVSGALPEFRPPLADQLFDDREGFANIALRYPRLRAIIPYLRRRAEKSVEEILEELEGEAPIVGKRKCQLLAVRYYLHDLLSTCTGKWLHASKRVTTYCTLLDQIAKYYQTTEPIPLVTFNYDMLIEDALGDHGFRTTSLSDYVGPASAFKLFKVHGSASWFRAVKYFGPRPQSPDQIIEAASNLEFTDIYSNDLSGQSSLFVPAIAVPVRNKSQFECPKEHVAELERLIPQVTKILFIGWRGSERHFIQMLKDKAVNLSYCMFVAKDAEDAEEIARRVMEDIGRIPRQRNFVTEGGFSEFIERRQGDRFFADQT
jgi:hypothetical protein